MKNKTFYNLLVLLLTFTIFPFNANAHGLETTESQVVGEYLVQLEYDTIGNINAGEAIRFSFELLDPDTKETIKFNRVFVRIVKKDGPLAYVGNQYALDVSGIIAANSSLILPEEGDYDFNLQFFRGEEKLIEHTFTLPVDPDWSKKNKSNGAMSYLWIMTLVGGLIGGIAYGKTLNVSKE